MGWGLELLAFSGIVGSTGARASSSAETMALSFKRPSYQFWSEATSDELYRLDLSELFTHLFCAKQTTTVDFLQWLPSCYHASPELKVEANHKLAMLQAPITYCNEDCDRRSAVSSWVMDNVPAGRWVEFRNHIAGDRWRAESEMKHAAM